MAIEENVDGLVHIFQDAMPTAGFAALAAQRRIFVVPTLTVLESAAGIGSGESLTTDPRLAPYLTAEEIANLRAYFPNKGGVTLDPALTTVAELHAAGVPIIRRFRYPESRDVLWRQHASRNGAARVGRTLTA